MANEEARAKEKEMSFWQHLEELRWHLVRSVLAIISLSIIAFIGKNIVFDQIILAPIKNDFISYQLLCKLGNLFSTDILCLDNSNWELINYHMSGQFITHLYVSFMVGLIVGFPYVFYQIWSFIKPALYDHEAKHTKGAVFICSVLFILGVLFSYFIVLPLTINFLGTYQISESVGNQIHLRSYISTVLSLTFSLGIVFELPVVVFFLSKAGILTSGYMKKNRKYMIVILLIVSAIITPPDWISQVMVVIPLMLLYELGISIAKRVEKSREEEE
ncbi:MAG: twin-arginine translocase subunit TatC [Hyphomicrobiales bacterium]